MADCIEPEIAFEEWPSYRDQVISVKVKWRSFIGFYKLWTVQGSAELLLLYASRAVRGIKL